MLRKLKFQYVVMWCLLMTIFSENMQGQDRWKAGVELDVLPYITGGYFGAGWIGKNHVRVRVLYAKVHLPQFIIPKGFTNNTIRSFAVVGDYFLKKEQAGWWLGAGLVTWTGEIQSDAKIGTATYKSYLLNGSLGYVFPVYKGLYVSPWAGLSLRMAGDSNVVVDGTPFKPPLINPEMSVKIGYGF